MQRRFVTTVANQVIINETALRGRMTWQGIKGIVGMDGITGDKVMEVKDMVEGN